MKVFYFFLLFSAKQWVDARETKLNRRSKGIYFCF